MTDQDKRLAIAAAHMPNAHERENSHVFSVWEDGELTMEKCGSLFGQRNCHTQDYGDASKAWDKNLFPMQNSTHGRCNFDNYDSAVAFRKVILG